MSVSACLPAVRGLHRKALELIPLSSSVLAPAAAEGRYSPSQGPFQTLGSMRHLATMSCVASHTTSSCACGMAHSRRFMCSRVGPLGPAWGILNPTRTSLQVCNFSTSPGPIDGEQHRPRQQGLHQAVCTPGGGSRLGVTGPANQGQTVIGYGADVGLDSDADNHNHHQQPPRASAAGAGQKPRSGAPSSSPSSSSSSAGGVETRSEFEPVVDVTREGDVLVRDPMSAVPIILPRDRDVTQDVKEETAAHLRQRGPWESRGSRQARMDTESAGLESDVTSGSKQPPTGGAPPSSVGPEVSGGVRSRTDEILMDGTMTGNVMLRNEPHLVPNNDNDEKKKVSPPITPAGNLRLDGLPKHPTSDPPVKDSSDPPSASFPA